jgi:redox-sensitive bicupin YhaK (pirin superfamily)
MIDVEEGGSHTIQIDKTHQSLVYLLNGNVTINNSETLTLNQNQLIEFNQDGNSFSIEGHTKSKLLFLSGTSFNEPVKSYGPYVMNTPTELMEAMRDYQQGKMGFLPAS